MRTFYLYENFRQEGPFSIDELNEKGISAHTPVWKEGMPEWMEAGKVEELASIVLKTPPAYRNNSSDQSQPHSYLSSITETEKKDRKIGKYLRWVGIFLIGVLVIGYINARNSGSIFNIKSPEELRAELLQTERLNPRNYINNNGKWRKNLIGETVLEGTLNNSASVAGFKDIVLEVEWMSKTEAVMGLRQLIVYEFIGAGKSVNYKLKAFGPSKFQGVRINVISATPLN